MQMLAAATALSDRELLDRLPQLAANERCASAELVAHLVALDMRPDVYAAEGYGSLFGYCTRALRLSEDAACTRIAVASSCRRFPRILELLSAGDLSLTAVRRVGPRLTTDNCESVLSRATNRSRSEIDALVAELAPQPDARPCIRRLPVESPTPTPPNQPASPSVRASRTVDPPRQVIEATAPESYRIHCTIRRAARDNLRRVQALLRRELPSGDVGLIVEQALELFVQHVEAAKLGKTARPRKRRATASSRSYLEFHHRTPYARGGQATVDNIALRCRRHNQYEARQVFGPSRAAEGAHTTVPETGSCGA